MAGGLTGLPGEVPHFPVENWIPSGTALNELVDTLNSLIIILSQQVIGSANTILNGNGPPSNGLGNNGDFYIDDLALFIYGPKAGGVWGSGTSIVGPQGPPGGGLAASGSVTANHLAVWTDGTGTSVKDGGAVPAAPGTAGLKNVGTSVLDPGTGNLEMVLPTQVDATGGRTWGAGDLEKRTLRSFGGLAMADTFPPAATSGLVNGARIVVRNADQFGTLVIAAGSGTTIGGGASFAVPPSREISWTYDTIPGTPNWDAVGNSDSTLLTVNNLSEVNPSLAQAHLGIPTLGQIVAIAVAN